MTLAEDAVRTLHTFHQAAAVAALQWYLHAGTLLGAVRDHDWCPGDEDDIDIAVFDEHFDKMGEITEGGWFRVLSRFIYKERVEGVKLQLADSNVHIDVSRLRRHPVTGDRFDIGTVAIEGERVVVANVYPRFCFRRYQTLTFQGLPCRVPDLADVLLDYRYGPDWRMPVHRKDWDWISRIPSEAIRTEYDGL